MTCDAHLGRLSCSREDGHEFGHVYIGSSDDLGKHGRHSDEADLT